MGLIGRGHPAWGRCSGLRGSSGCVCVCVLGGLEQVPLTFLGEGP